MAELSQEFIQGMASGGALAALAGLFVFLIIFALAIYVYSALALMAIARRTNTPKGWLAWIPIGNIYLLTQVGRQSGWWTLGILAAPVPFLGGPAIAALMIFLMWKAAESCKRPGWWGILTIIPLANLVILGLLAWGQEAAQGPTPAAQAPPPAQ